MAITADARKIVVEAPGAEAANAVHCVADGPAVDAIYPVVEGV
jgi:hypothetical protein